MFTLKVGDYELTHNPLYAITSVTGLSPAAASINTATIGNNDGSKFNSSRVNERNIVITIQFLQSVEAARINLYQHFKTKKICRLYYSNGVRNVYIDGYVESMDCDLFTQNEFMQISIICNNPFFRSTNESVSEMALMSPRFEFPFDIDAEGVEFSAQSEVATATIHNGGDIESGVKIELQANGEVVNPSIVNSDTLERFDLNYTMDAGDKITIDTIKNERSVMLLQNGVMYNIINTIGQYPDWLQLAVGDNNFTYLTDDGDENLTVTIKHTDLFEGV